MVTFSQGNCRVAEVECKSVLNKSGLADYAVNCYAGCEHGCCYCYARFATRFSHPGESWGSFVDVKVNAPQILSREVSRKRMGRVFVSSVCDGWQPSEAKYFLTRQCLEILLNHGYSITTLTKNVLAGRDLDLLALEAGVEFGVTITTLDENLRRLVEPSSSSSDGRLGLLQEAKGKGITTYVFLGPLLPYLSDTEANLILLLKAGKEVDADYFYVDRLNPRFGLWPPLKSLLEEHFPDLITEYQQILFDELIRIKYSERLISKVSHLSRQQGLDG